MRIKDECPTLIPLDDGSYTLSEGLDYRRNLVLCCTDIRRLWLVS